ncbi:MAG: VOC family protein [Burkholderiaceae bacterium]
MTAVSPAASPAASSAASLSPRIDHAVINVGRRLDDAQARFERLGFQLTPRGHHSRGTSNHLVILGSDYIELIGVEPSRTGVVDWGHPPGLVGLVFKTDDARRLAAELAGRGVPLDPAGASDLSRPVDLADGGTRDARFLTLRLAPERVANGRVFFCEHRTPELVWQAAWQRHPNGATGVAEYVYAAEDPARAAALVGQVFASTPIVEVPGGRRMAAGVGSGAAAVSWLVPDEIVRRYGDAALAPIHDPAMAGADRAIALELAVADVAAAKAALDAGQVPYTVQPDGGLRVAPGQALGTTLVFRPAASPAAPRA